MRRSRHAFTTIRSEGALLPADFLQRLSEQALGIEGLTPESYHLGEHERLREAISRSWQRLLGFWQTFQKKRADLPAEDRGTTLTRDKWLRPLFQELGYGHLPAAPAFQIENRSYKFAATWQHAPIHLVSFRLDLDGTVADESGQRRPHSLLQEFLNRSPEHVWGFVSNGLRLRVLRDSVALTRQAFIEFDLEAMMTGEVFADFCVLWLVCHQSRVEGATGTECWLEKWMHAASKQGVAALDKMGRGVREAIEELGTGFLRHRHNRVLVTALQSGALTAVDFYRELLRVAYRLLFLFVAEDRTDEVGRPLIFRPDSTADARERYLNYYSLSRLRRLAERRHGTPHCDLWRSFAVVVGRLGDDDGCDALGLPALGSFLWSPGATPHLNGCDLPNRELLAAIRALAFTEENHTRRPVDFRNLASDELGSVYQGLLELEPQLENENAGLRFRLGSGGEERRASGSHYTPGNPLNRVLDFALEPVIAECLRAPDPQRALLSLRILDPACGSGHVLVGAANRIAHRLATLRTGDSEPSPEARRHALREVAACCLYGVDVNPLAVELCKVALWMETLEPGKPLSFLDHHIRCGNSLIGIPPASAVQRQKREIAERREVLAARIIEAERALLAVHDDQDTRERLAEKLKRLRKEHAAAHYESWPEHLPDDAFDPASSDSKPLAREVKKQNRADRKARGAELFTAGSTVVHEASVFPELTAGAAEDITALHAQERSFDRAQHDEEYRRRKLVADAWCAAFFWALDGMDEVLVPTEGILFALRHDPTLIPEEKRALLLDRIARLAECHRFFHYELAFPEVFTSHNGCAPGFDLTVGNPPYLGGLKISTHYGDKFLTFLKANHPEASGTTDLVAYFFRLGFDVLRSGGHVGLLATNTIAQGDTRAAALAPIATRWGGIIANAVRSMPWEGVAALEVSVIHIVRGEWKAPRTLDDRVVEIITPMLDDGTGGRGEPVRLEANVGVAFNGSYVFGNGFTMDENEARRLINRNASNADCIFPYINGDDLNSRSDQSPSRWVINFFGWPLERVDAEVWSEADEGQREQWVKLGRVAPDYDGKVAADYDELIDIVRETVKPARAADKRANYREKWWQFAERRPGLYEALAGMARVIVVGQTSKFHSFVVVPANVVFDQKLVVFIHEDLGLVAVLQSTFHQLWVLTHGCSLETRPVYTPSDCFGTFPFPDLTPELSAIGAEYHEHRRSCCIARQLGLTKLYNLFHDDATERDDAPVQRAAPPFDDIRHLRTLHRRLDETVLTAYRVTAPDLFDAITLDHAFHTGRAAASGLKEAESRFTPSLETRSRLLRALLTLNHRRAAAEAEARERGEPIIPAFVRKTKAEISPAAATKPPLVVGWPSDDTALVIPSGHRAARQPRAYLEDLVLALLALGRGRLPLERLIAACRLLSDHQRLRELGAKHDAATARAWKKSKPQSVQRTEFRPLIIQLCNKHCLGMFRSDENYEVRMLDETAWARCVADSPEAAAFVLADARFAILILDLEAIAASDDELWFPIAEAAELATP